MGDQNNADILDDLSANLATGSNVINTTSAGTNILTTQVAGATVASSTVINGKLFNDAVRGGGALYDTALSVKATKAIREVGTLYGGKVNSSLSGVGYILGGVNILVDGLLWYYGDEETGITSGQLAYRTTGNLASLVIGYRRPVIGAIIGLGVPALEESFKATHEYSVSKPRFHWDTY